MQCRQEQNQENCNCPFECSRKGICCECLRHHLRKRQLPACCFPDEVAATHERSFEAFVELVKGKRV